MRIGGTSDEGLAVLSWRYRIRLMPGVFGVDAHVICTVCENRDAEGFCCLVCTSRMRRWLTELPELYQRLHERHQLDPLPPSAGGNQVGVRVGGSKERKLPIDLDTVDLLAGLGYRKQTVVLEAGERWWLWAWVCLLRSRWFSDESLPAREVPALTLWLWLRLETVVQVDQDTPALAEALRGSVGQLRHVLGEGPIRPELLSDRCPKCRYKTLKRYTGEEFIECEHCKHLVSLNEYEAMVSNC